MDLTFGNIESYLQENLLKERKNAMANNYTYYQLVQKSICESSLNANLLLDNGHYDIQLYLASNTALTDVT